MQGTAGETEKPHVRLLRRTNMGHPEPNQIQRHDETKATGPPF
jgi:hypothetical protein